MPNLENLKKQAKQILRLHRQGSHPAAAQIRHALPCFRSASDREILAAKFQLSDAQEVVARQNGFETWEALKKGLTIMEDIKAETGLPELARAYPQIFCTDFARTRDFFIQSLGFTLAFETGAPSFYGQVRRGEARLNLRHADPLPFDPALCARAEYLAAYITVINVKALFLAYQAAQVPFHKTLGPTPYGTTEFIVKDPDGNLILFGSQTDVQD